jgi:hypothetical protein
MNINEAIRQLELAKAEGHTDIVFAYWDFHAFDMEKNPDWSAIAEWIEENMDWSEAHDQMVYIIKEGQEEKE